MKKTKKSPDLLKLAAKCVPTNWCDPLLTGPNAVLPKGGGRITPRHIEALLRGIQDRIRALEDTHE